MMRRQGMVTETEINQFLDAGYTRQQLLEVIPGICVKVFSNLPTTPSESLWTTHSRHTSGKRDRPASNPSSPRPPERRSHMNPT
jgi:hypothetical protein